MTKSFMLQCITRLRDLTNQKPDNQQKTRNREGEPPTQQAVVKPSQVMLAIILVLWPKFQVPGLETLDKIYSHQT